MSAWPFMEARMSTVLRSYAAEEYDMVQKDEKSIHYLIENWFRYSIYTKEVKGVENCGLTFWTEKASDILTNSLQASVIKCD